MIISVHSARALTAAAAVAFGAACGDGSSAGDEALAATCNQVIGESQVKQWYRQDNAFESTVDGGSWQLLWQSGGGVDQWRDPLYDGWANDVVSPCTEASTEPDRVVLSVNGPYGDDEDAWRVAIEETIAIIRQTYASARQIVLMPVVGGPRHRDCLLDGARVLASWQHRHIDNAIAAVTGVETGGDVVAGFSPEVGSCTHYADEAGHLTREGAIRAATAIGAYYQLY